jgi:glutathione S-transferase
MRLFKRKSKMITVHHLNNSRSHRVLWLMDELGLDYELTIHQRDATTNLAPPELLAVHPLGKSPVVVDDGEVIIESGAIIEHITRVHGKGKMAPEMGTPDYTKYVQLLHYAEGSAMLPLMLRMYTGRLGEGGAPLQPRIDDETKNHLGYLNSLLEGQDYFLGKALSAADVQLSFAIEVGGVQGQLENFANLQGFLERIKARPAYKSAIERGGPYAF